MSLPLYAVLGNPIQHSLSPQIQQSFAQDCNISLTYLAQEVPLDNFNNFCHQFFQQANGANVTVPFKEQAFQLVNHATERAIAAQAVNTIKKLSCGSLLGDNTDGIGLVTDLQQNLNFSLQGTKILLIGAGGAAKGVIQPLLQQQPEYLHLTNRTLSKAQLLVEQLAQFGKLSALDLQQLNSNYDLIINATSASLQGKQLNLPNIVIKAQHTLCYDMMYSKQITSFNQWAQELQAYTADGIGMLVEQAAAAFELWHSIRPSTSAILKQLKN